MRRDTPRLPCSASGWTSSRTLVPLLMAAVLGGCGDGEPAPRWLGTIDTVDGVPIVRNPAEPMLPAGAVQLERVWWQGGPETGDAFWQNPRDLTADAGAVFVLDRAAARVYRLDAATGDQVSTFGSQGEGPGELGNPAGIAILEAGPVVLDGGTTLERFTADGRHLGAVRHNAIVFGIHDLDGRSALATSLGREASLFNVVDTAGLHPVEVPDPRADVDPHFDDCRRFGATGGLPTRLSCVRPYFQRFTIDGTAVREIFVDRDVESRSEQELAEFAAPMRREMAEAGLPASRLEALVDRIIEGHRTRRGYRAVRQDRSTGWTGFWEQEEEDFGGGPATLHLFDERGAYVAAVAGNAPWWDFVWVDGDIVALVRDPATDLVRAVRYRFQPSPLDVHPTQ